MKRTLLSLLLAGAFIPAAQAAPNSILDTCVNAALTKHPGVMESLSSEVEDGKPQYEIDIKGKDGNGWEVECDASTGKIIRFEKEIRANSAEFKSKAKVRLDGAIKLVLDKYPGVVVNTEYDMEDDGEISYEFIVQTNDGKTIEIEVDAVTGKLAGFEEVHFRIGR